MPLQPQRSEQEYFFGEDEESTEMGRFVAAQEGQQLARGLSEYYAHDRVFNYGDYA